MLAEIAIPLWLFILLGLSFIYTLIFAVGVPGLKWYIRRGATKTADSKNKELQIKIKPFLRTRRRVIVDRLCNDTKVIESIDLSLGEGDKKRSTLEHEVKEYAKEIVPYFNAFIYFKIGYWFAKTIIRFLYRVKVGAANASLLDDIDPDATVVFVMNHRSNIDYLLVSYLVADKATLSYAVGEWARVFPLTPLIKSLGAFFVRRGSGNPLYRKVLERYVHMTTKEGVCQAVYLEGGLSRDGNFMDAKLGFLDYMIRDFNHEHDRDIVFVPAAINYDRVLEDNNMLNWNEPENRKSKRQHVFNLIKFMQENMYLGARLRWRKFGYASVNFGIPISAKQFATDRDIYFPKLNKEERFVETQVLADQLMLAIKHVMPILPVPLIATVFSQSDKSALRSLGIFARADQIIEQMIANGAAMKRTEKPRNRTLSESLKLLVDRGILIESNDHYQVAEGADTVLAYYANSLGHWFKETSQS